MTISRPTPVSSSGADIIISCRSIADFVEDWDFCRCGADRLGALYVSKSCTARRFSITGSFETKVRRRIMPDSEVTSNMQARPLSSRHIMRADYIGPCPRARQKLLSILKYGSRSAELHDTRCCPSQWAHGSSPPDQAAAPGGWAARHVRVTVPQPAVDWAWRERGRCDSELSPSLPPGQQPESRPLDIMI